MTGHACAPGCVIRCSNIYPDKDGNYLTASLEYETLCLMGSNLGIDCLDTIARIDRKCDDYGLDTIELGNAIGVAMYAGVAEFGDGKAALELVDEVIKGTVLGRVLGQGCVVCGKVFGVQHVAASKGQGMAGYDPRTTKGFGVTYATSPMGADHTAGNLFPGRMGVTYYLKDGQIEASRGIQIMTAVSDSLGLCIFTGTLPPDMERISNLLTCATGKTFSVEDTLRIGEETLRTELSFNRKAGFTEKDDRIPEFFKKEELPPNKYLFDIDDEELDKVFCCMSN
jgi:aldehyde:ferredoxin oxidoreductase